MDKEQFEAQNDKAVDLAYTGREITIREVVRADGGKGFELTHSHMHNLFEIYGILTWAVRAVGSELHTENKETDAPQTKG